MKELLLSQWTDIQATLSSKRGGAKPAVFEGSRGDRRVHVAFRRERPGSEIYAVFDAGKMITMVLLHRFGEGEAGTEAAKEVAIKLAKMYIDEGLTKGQLVKRRDELLPTRTSKPKEAIMKRPAQAEGREEHPDPEAHHDEGADEAVPSQEETDEKESSPVYDALEVPPVGVFEVAFSD